ncbi:hypothetical protein C9374_001596 [Naegleria lovaniensis]|uniref:Uncharacterized protein n=1 Tax=Naegleria lovaniensis TaxID=51637 RepID=A0AA88KMT5_NAELO|nr:uncharacterized protein C9374_001596 [Naegleria lovaniensis]KAG2387264.1 hypothetical protein C9374_001596 [Naegleria lovaniensis]
MGQWTSSHSSAPRVETVLQSDEQLFYYRNFQAHANCAEKVRQYKALNKLIDLREHVDSEHVSGKDPYQDYHNRKANNLSSEEKRKHENKYQSLKDMILENACVMCQVFAGRPDESQSEHRLRACMGDELVDWSLMRRNTDDTPANQRGDSEEEQFASYSNLPSLNIDYDRVVYCFHQDNALAEMFNKLTAHKRLLTQKGSFQQLFPNIVNELRKKTNDDHTTHDSVSQPQFNTGNTSDLNSKLLHEISQKHASKERAILDSCINKSDAQIHPGGHSCLGEAIIYSHALTTHFCKRSLNQCLEKKVPSFIIDGLEDDEAWNQLSVIDFSQCLTSKSPRSMSPGEDECSHCFDQVMEFMTETVLKE